MFKVIAVFLSLMLAGSAFPAFSASSPSPTYGFAIQGQLKYPADFKNFDYVNPNAPKGGELRQAAIGTFDSLNPFIIKGQPTGIVSATFDTLLVQSADEPGSSYCLVAESLEVPEDRSWVIFNLRPEARFHDGSPITADDVVFSFDILRNKGAPLFRSYYASVVKAEKLGDHRVRFIFKPGKNQELPEIVGQIPILSKKYWQTRAFDQTTLEAPLASGPYKVESLEAGRTILLSRVPDYWAKNLPVNKGRYNFDRMRVDYYRDSTVALEAFKAGEFDLRVENESKKWATGYDFPAVSQGLVKLQKFPNQRSQGIQGFAYNIRRPLFQDPRVRRALFYAFDFEWTNKTLFYGQYQRMDSYFSNSDLASHGLPDAEELKLLDPLRADLPPALFTTPYTLPVNPTPDSLRDNLRTAAQMLKEAGWVVKDGKLVNEKTGEPFVFEILNYDPAMERITTPFTQNLERLGITASIKTVDPGQYQNRINDFNFDMIVNIWLESASPGNEQREFWGSATADLAGTQNLVGIKNKAIDALIDLVIAAPDRQSLITRVHALDRALLWGDYVIPHWYMATDRVAYWDKFGMPDKIPTEGIQLDAWWVDSARAEKIQPAK